MITGGASLFLIRTVIGLARLGIFGTLGPLMALVRLPVVARGFGRPLTAGRPFGLPFRLGPPCLTLLERSLRRKGPRRGCAARLMTAGCMVSITVRDATPLAAGCVAAISTRIPAPFDGRRSTTLVARRGTSFISRAAWVVRPAVLSTLPAVFGSPSRWPAISRLLESRPPIGLPSIEARSVRSRFTNIGPVPRRSARRSFGPAVTLERLVATGRLVVTIGLVVTIRLVVAIRPDVTPQIVVTMRLAVTVPSISRPVTRVPREVLPRQWSPFVAARLRFVEWSFIAREWSLIARAWSFIAPVCVPIGSRRFWLGETCARILVLASGSPVPTSTLGVARTRYARRARLFRRVPEAPAREPLQDDVLAGAAQLVQRGQQVVRLLRAKCRRCVVDENRPVGIARRHASCYPGRVTHGSRSSRLSFSTSVVRFRLSRRAA